MYVCIYGTFINFTLFLTCAVGHVNLSTYMYM